MPKRPTLKERTTVPKERKTTRSHETSKTSAFQNDTQKKRCKEQRSRNPQTTSKDLKKTTGFLIREITNKMTTTGGDINLAPENTGNDDNHDDGDLNLEGNDDDTGDATAQATFPAAGGGTGGNGPMNFNLRVEQNKIPEFFGAKSKNTISAADFIHRLEDLAKTNRWTDAQNYHHFANSLQNPA